MIRIIFFVLIIAVVLIIVSKLKKTGNTKPSRRSLNELEADLVTSDGKRIGEAEWEHYSDNSTKLKVKIYTQESCEVIINGQSIGHTALYKERQSLYLESVQGQHVPQVNVGDEVVILSKGFELAKGTFRPDR